MTTTKIEWAERVWNPITGCTKCSPACDHCYAERMSKRLAGRCGYPAVDPFQVTLHEDKFDTPLKWQRPSRIFVGSMTDLFHEDVPDEQLDKIFATMAMASREHTFMLCTKRPERMLAYLTHEYRRERIFKASGGSELFNLGWPLPNVWLGTTIWNQASADRAVPILLSTPAAKHFVSVEPMLGPVDLGQWVRPIAMMRPDHAPSTWEEWNTKGLWPAWVPKKWQALIEDFWSDRFGRSPRSWLHDAISQNAAPHGEVFNSKSLGVGGERVEGRFLHTWNNMCVLVDANGEAHVSSTPFRHVGESYLGLDWVICGGETGPGARPMHPDWPRSLRDQCQAAEVPYFFKQWGEWSTAHTNIATGEPSWWTFTDFNHYCAKAPTHMSRGDKLICPDGHIPTNGGKEGKSYPMVPVRRVGKRKAGRVLDGRTWEEVPNA